ncbi:MAG: hypothetical protein HQL56_07190 [Magnetococcales bacterium]|nr:hypothetical protein [Magnetococcales bacterium]
MEVDTEDFRCQYNRATLFIMNNCRIFRKYFSGGYQFPSRKSCTVLGKFDGYVAAAVPILLLKAASDTEIGADDRCVESIFHDCMTEAIVSQLIYRKIHPESRATSLDLFMLSFMINFSSKIFGGTVFDETCEKILFATQLSDDLRGALQLLARPLAEESRAQCSEESFLLADVVYLSNVICVDIFSQQSIFNGYKINSKSFLLSDIQGLSEHIRNVFFPLSKRCMQCVMNCGIFEVSRYAFNPANS